jgi:hypothetical protein
MTSLTGSTPCFVPPPRDASNDAWDFLLVIRWLLESGGLVNGDILILDNARVHHAADAGVFVKGLLQLHGVEIRYLPAYSPELNPCEMVFSWVKDRMVHHRTKERMWAEALRLFASVEPAMMDNWYRDCLFNVLL